MQHLIKHDKSLKTKSCPKCQILHTKSGTFCSRKCANSKKQSNEANLKRSLALKGKCRKLFTPVSQCKICQKWFAGKTVCCSNECKSINSVNIGREGGKKGASKTIKRSKDEIALYDLCHSLFMKVEHNNPLFNGWDADILIYDFKLAILWNGPWHYKEMNFGNHSLKQVQNRDKIKIEEIKKAGWTPIIFEDRFYSPESAFKFIKNFLIVKD